MGNKLRKKGVGGMARKQNGAQVVIVRKDKKLNKTGHLFAFMFTGGASSVYTATKAATNAGYNARTRELQRQSEAAQTPANAAPAPAETARPPGPGYKLIPAAGYQVTDPAACPRCGRSGVFAKGAAGGPHVGMGRRWCPGAR